MEGGLDGVCGVVWCVGGFWLLPVTKFGTNPKSEVDWHFILKTERPEFNNLIINFVDLIPLLNRVENLSIIPNSVGCRWYENLIE